MTDTDIVTKLNREADQAASLLSNPNNTGKRMALIDGSLLREAVNEIERLRKELYEAQIIAVHQSALLLKKSPNEIADQMNWNCLDDKENTNA